MSAPVLSGCIHVLGVLGLSGAANVLAWAVIALGGVVLAKELLGLRYIPHSRVGIIEKFWSLRGSVTEGRIIALRGEAGYQADVLRGGVHFFLWRWQYRIYTLPLVTVSQGKIGYVYARDGEPLLPQQTLGSVVSSNNFQDARAFLGHTGEGGRRGQRGRQRAIVREGVYAVNLALFVVITEDAVYRLDFGGRDELKALMKWQDELTSVGGFDPVVVGGAIEGPDPQHPGKKMVVDSIAIVTVHDGPPLPPGEIIAPAVGTLSGEPNYHNNYQDPEAFLSAGGLRGRQYVPLTDGTYFINRWFATVEMIAKTVVPIGFVGVVVSYYGERGRDVSGDQFRHGELVGEGEVGVRKRPLGPGKYAFNTYAAHISFVPTTNFVLHWITGRTEEHLYDETLRSIELVTMDAYEPVLPLSVVLHIDYEKAPSVIQRFGDVKKLITQTLDPLLSAYFRDVVHLKTMLELLQQRDEIQAAGRGELRRRFLDFDIECVDVLVGKPDTSVEEGKIEVLLEQLRLRQLSIEQLETYERQRAAAVKLRDLHEAEAKAAMQTQLTESHVQISIAENQGGADLARARKQAEQIVVTAEADSRQRILLGRGDAQKALQVGMAEAAVLLRKVASYVDPRLYAASMVAEHLSHSAQPLVPERVFVAGGGGAPGEGEPAALTQGMLGLLISLLVADRTGFDLGESKEIAGFRDIADRMARQALESLQKPDEAPPAPEQGASEPQPAGAEAPQEPAPEEPREALVVELEPSDEDEPTGEVSKPEPPAPGDGKPAS